MIRFEVFRPCGAEGIMPAETIGGEWDQGLPTIPASRVVLASLGPADVPRLFEIFSNPDVTRYWGSPALRSMEEAADLLSTIREGLQTRRLFQWGIRPKSGDGVIGTCTLLHMDLVHRRSELGFALGREHWGQGLALEAVAALIDWSFQTLKLHRLEADVDPRNDRSLNLLERLGFQREGYLRERYHEHGETQDTVFLGLLVHDWRKPKSMACKEE
jgi:[ribosomal protein S5]-alanine N-acetyltransferase